jgi:tRNA(Arg) A34 adenosine deaminase TadA
MQELKRISPSGLDPTEKQIEKHILAANEIAREAIQQGRHPFGAILVDADNQTVLMSQGNIDTVNHA